MLKFAFKENEGKRNKFSLRVEIWHILNKRELSIDNNCTNILQ